MNIKLEELTESKHFCLMPWIHIHAWPNGNVYPCCMAEPNLIYGNTNKQPVAEIINSAEFKKLRTNMLQDKPSESCNRCYELEKSGNAYTLRKNSVASFKHLIKPSIESTDQDGKIQNFKMAYMDIRFSNLCNFKCRTCSEDFSSLWQEENAQGSKTIPLSLLQNENFWKELEPYLLDVEEVYFAGGEAFISPEHYKILNYWIENKKNKIRIRYTTNFSHFKFKSEDLLELWKNFEDVRVAASLDAEGRVGEYARAGTNWQQIEKNRINMIELAPHVYFEITPTLSIYNAFNLPKLHREWIEKKLLEPNNIRINYLLQPDFMRAQILPKNKKQQIVKLYQQHIEYLKNLENTGKVSCSRAVLDFEGAISFLSEEINNADKLIEEFLSYNKKLDIRRNENLMESIPELFKNSTSGEPSGKPQ